MDMHLRPSRDCLCEACQQAAIKLGPRMYWAGTEAERAELRKALECAVKYRGAAEGRMKHDCPSELLASWEKILKEWGA